MRFLFFVFVAGLILAPATSVFAQNNDCPTPVNGTLKGEAGNDQDNVFHSLAIDPVDDATVYVGTETNGIFKTTDRGQTWTRLRTGLKCTTAHTFYPEVYDIAVDSQNHQTVYAATVTGPGPASPVTFPSASAGVYRSTDGGQTWVQKNTGLPSTYVTQVLVDTQRANHIYAVVGGLQATFPTSGTFYNGGVFESANGGDTWTQLALPSGVETNIFGHALLAGADQRTLYLSGQVHRGEAPQAYGFVRSGNGGTSWEAALNPANEFVNGFDVFKLDPNFIYANVISARRVQKSVDGGATWTAIGPSIFFGVVKIHPLNNQVAYYTGSPAGSVWKTIDGFTTQQQLYADATLASDQHMSDIEIAPSNSNTIWAASTGYFLYRSSDGGNTWTKITAVRDAIYGPSSSSGDGPSGSAAGGTTTIGPLRFTDASATMSYVRFINPTAVAGTVQVTVRDDEGTSLGTFSRQVDPYTAPQLSMREVEAAASVSKPGRTGAFAQLEVHGTFSGFVQNVLYDFRSGVFTNLSFCRSSAGTGSAAAGTSTDVANVHTTRLAAYPSRIILQNGDAVQKIVTIDVHDSATGAIVGRWSPLFPLLALGSMVVSMAQIQQDINFTPTTAQPHVNLNLVNTSNVIIGHIVDNTVVGSDSDMSLRCAF